MPFALFKKREILPEVLYALRSKLPDHLDVEISSIEDGYYLAKVKNAPGCITQAKNPQELFLMVNDAVYTYFDVPEQYKPFVRSNVSSFPFC